MSSHGTRNFEERLLLVVIVALAVAWCVAGEGAWGAGLTFLCVLFAGLLAMNFFEPVAGMLDGFGSGFQDYSDLTALVGLFTLFTFLGRLAAENISPTEIEFDGRIYNVARWLFGLATGYTTMAILLTALHTAPLPRSFIGFSPERANFFDTFAPDRQWLGFTQHVSEKVLRSKRVFDGSHFKMAPGTDQEYWPSVSHSLRDATARLCGRQQHDPRPSAGAGRAPRLSRAVPKSRFRSVLGRGYTDRRNGRCASRQSRGRVSCNWPAARFDRFSCAAKAPPYKAAPAAPDIGHRGRP